PGDQWLSRIAGPPLTRHPVGPAEAFLALVRDQVYARAKDIEDGYSIETDCRPADAKLLDAAQTLNHALARLEEPMMELADKLLKRLDAEAAELDSATRGRIEAVARSLRRRAQTIIAGWRAMLKSLSGDPPEDYVDWFAVERFDGRDGDVGFHRHWIDPTVPFVAAVARPAHGVLITSATLTDISDRPPKEETDADPVAIGWAAAETRTGARHLPEHLRARVPSP